ncbi:hypothetical protein PG991_007434 [Apiospora marii]|uniref:Ribosomal protein S17 n=1 Tax=Apiospora marii TaxID=335849 RepID=A0ABR1RUN4_9PEZI
MSAPGASRVLEAAASGIGHAGRMYKGSKTGVVVSAGLMDKTVKSFKYPHYHLVHDPSNSVRQGDVISIAAGWRESSRKKHVVKHILAPYGTPIDARPPVPTEEELKANYVAQRVVKIERREAAAKERREIKQRELAEAEERRAQKLAKARLHQQEGTTTKTTTSITDVD